MTILTFHPGLQLRLNHPIDDLPYIVFGILFLVGSILIGEYLRKKKHKQIRLAGYEVGLGDDLDRKHLQEVLRTANFTLVKDASIPHVLPILKGRKKDVEILAFDMIVYKDGPPGSGPKRLSILLSLDEPQLVHCVIRPKSVWDKVGEGFHGNVVPFHDQPAFDDSYLVTGYDEEMISALLCPRVTDFLTSHPRLTIELLPKRMLLFQADRKIKPEDLQPLLNDALALFALLRQSAEEAGIAAEWKELP